MLSARFWLGRWKSDWLDTAPWYQRRKTQINDKVFLINHSVFSYVLTSRLAADGNCTLFTDLGLLVRWIHRSLQWVCNRRGVQPHDRQFCECGRNCSVVGCSRPRITHLVASKRAPLNRPIIGANGCPCVSAVVSGKGALALYKDELMRSKILLFYASLDCNLNTSRDRLFRRRVC